MDHLLAYLIALLSGDACLKKTFEEAMTNADFAKNLVNVVSEDERSTASYPRIVIGGDEGKAMSFGDGIPPLFLDGHVRIEVVTQKSDRCPQPLAVQMAITNRIRDLFLGNETLNLTGVKGMIVSPAVALQPWRVTVWNQTVSRKLPAVDPIFKRHLMTYAVQIYRLIP